jgi:hypothetical protein
MTRDMDNYLVDLELHVFDNVEVDKVEADEEGYTFDTFDIFLHYDKSKSDMRGRDFVATVWYEEIAYQLAEALQVQVNESRLNKIVEDMKGDKVC